MSLRWRTEIFAVVYVLSTLLFYLACISFDPSDPSPLSGSFPRQAHQNWVGVWGSWISATLFFVFGYYALLLPLPGLFVLYRALKSGQALKSSLNVFSWFILFVSSLLLSTLLLPTLNPDLTVSHTGVLGHTVAEISQYVLGKLGAMITAFTGMALSILMLIHLSPSVLFSRIRKRPSPLKSQRESNLKNVKQEMEILPTDLTEKSVVSEPEPNFIDQGDRPHPTFDISYNQAELMTLFQSQSETSNCMNDLQCQEISSSLLAALEEFGVTGKMLGWQVGPMATVFEFQPAAGIKQAKIHGLIDDLALVLKVESIFIHPVPGKRALGIQVANLERETVLLGDIIRTTTFQNSQSVLTYAVGKSLRGDPVCLDLTKMPHLLVAGSTGSGKSVGINALLCSLIVKTDPSQVRMILVDPKMLELSVYEGIPHLLMPVITDMSKAASALKWAINEMERRYSMMQRASVRNIEGFNIWWESLSLHEKEDFRGLCQDDDCQHMSYIVVVIDELADLMLSSAKDVETAIQKLAQKARASGIHLVLATQRPSVDVITGVIKANLPCRIAYQVVSKHDSRTILDLVGAEKLLGKGDLLFQQPGKQKLERVQGALVSDQEVISLVKLCQNEHHPKYCDKVIDWINSDCESKQEEQDLILGDDEKFEEAVEIARNQGAISASFIQRRCKIGYNRAARIIEEMEKRGLISKADGSKPRQWIRSTL